MLQLPSDTYIDNYHIHIDENGIALIKQLKANENINSLKEIRLFSELLLQQIKKDSINAILYIVPQVDSSQVYSSLIASCLVNQGTEIVEEIYSNILILNSIEKPIVALIADPCHNLSIASALWAKQRLALVDVDFSFQDTKYGIFGGFGINTVFSQIGDHEVSIPFLLKQAKYSASEAMRFGLVVDTASDLTSLFEKAKVLIVKDGNLIAQNHSNLDQSLIDDTNMYISKYAKRLPKGLTYAFDNYLFSCKHSFRESLNFEQELFSKLWKDPLSLAYLRTQYFGIKDAMKKAKEISLPNFKLNRLGILGAGMMGAGIAFEAAKSGVDVVLKDSTLEKAGLGKEYSLQVSNRLIQQQRMSITQQEQLLNHIFPTENITDFEDVDLVIEAVYEDKQLKAQVTSESVEYLSNDGFFASNTTSIPISDLAKATPNQGGFIGMHFFSPVDRMALVEIIKGEKTTSETLKKSLYVSAILGKIPIVVNDGPAFFTSRIFFNYLLEAITMVMEGVEPQQIEEQAKYAGFGASPLAVLDEISLPLMLQVYNQLPSMHSGQKLAYLFLSEMVSSGRAGRKSNAGFYTYNSNGKELWVNPSVQVKKSVEPKQIQKRLLHVVALDSFRCLDSKIVEQPIDADLGSTLGLGYPATTGGVISYIDLIGIQQFVKDCEEFESFGEQWILPEKLIELANTNFSFYTGLKSNWK